MEPSTNYTLKFMRRCLPWLAGTIVIVLAYDGWVFWSRARDRREAQEAVARQEQENARKTIAMLGGDQLKINSFYATAGVVKAGEPVNMCYGVNAAKTVRLEPPVETLYPAVSHCFQVSPRKETTYKLIAEDGAGHSVSESLTIKVTR